MVVDPPRAGLHPRVAFRIAELAPERIIYASCNPATLARDLKDFAQYGWRLAEVTPFDMFPHTLHIECVARVVRGQAGPSRRRGRGGMLRCAQAQGAPPLEWSVQQSIHPLRRGRS